MTKCPKCERAHTLTFSWTEAREGKWRKPPPKIYMHGYNEMVQWWTEYWYPELPESLDVACTCGFKWRKSEEFLFNTPDPPEKVGSMDMFISRTVPNLSYKPPTTAPPPEKKRWSWDWSTPFDLSGRK